MITGDVMDITRRFMVVYNLGDITFAITCTYIGYQQIHVCCFTTSNCFQEVTKYTVFLQCLSDYMIMSVQDKNYLVP